MKLRTNLILLRHQNDLTQESLGRMLGISKGMVQSYEDGRAEPSLDTIKKIVDTFGIDDLYLFLYK
jgi:transcriptional regulator with XRE-family HTH domain